jgi:hypothetical protein
VQRDLSTAEQSPSSFGCEIEGQIKIYANLDALLDSIQQCKPLSGMVATDGSVWVAYRPKAEAYRMDTSKTTQRDWSKSALSLLRVQFDDANGQLVSGLCWFAPIKVSTDDDMMTLGSLHELQDRVEQYALFLPQLDKNENYKNLFYGIGSKWSVRASSGLFEKPNIAANLFEDWQTS